MSVFRFSRQWRKIDNNTIARDSEVDGELREFIERREPSQVFVNATKPLALETLSWEVPDGYSYVETPKYVVRRLIRADGKIDRGYIHCLSLESSLEPQSFGEIEVEIHPIPSYKLEQTSTVSEYGLDRMDEEVPTSGFLKDEIGRLRFFEASEVNERSTLSVMVFLDRENFNYVFDRISRDGRALELRLTILADLFFDHLEQTFAPTFGDRNYAMVLEERDHGGRLGLANARLNSLTIEFGKKHIADGKNTYLNDDPISTAHSKTQPGPSRDAIDDLGTLAADVRRVRKRLDTVFLVAVVAAAFYFFETVF
jgi:hypothetical protein